MGGMRALKFLGILVLAYIGIVVAFESLIGYLQPQRDTTLVITTFENGEPHDRVVSRLESGGSLYVAANHWPRAWYHRALENPEVEVTDEDATTAYRAVPVTGEEHARVAADRPLPLPFRILTGFPPRHFLRLDPR